jgi:hypothetical protein
MDNNLLAVRTLEGQIAALGTLSAQDANNVAISGGTIGGIPVSSIALAGSASGITFTPTGGISAVDVQSALAELDGDKAATGHTHAGMVTTVDIHAANSRATPVDVDELPLLNSDDSYSLVKLTWANVKATLKTYLDTLYATVAHTHAGVYEPADANTAKLDVDQTWTGAQRGTVTTDNDGSFDQSVSNNFSCTPSGNVTLTFTNHTAGQSGFVLFINTGGHTGNSLAATTKADSNFLTTINATGTYLIAYFDNGTNAYVTTTGALA